MGDERDAAVLAELFTRFGTVVSGADADSMGIPRAMLRRGVARSTLIRVAKCAFVQQSRWADMTPWQRFRARAVGFGMSSAADVHLAGWAAVAVLDIPTVHCPPHLPTALRPGDPHRGPDRTVYGRTRNGYLPPQHRMSRDRVQTVDYGFAVVDVARHYGPVAGLVAADHVLHRGASLEVLARLTEDLVNHPGIQTARWVLHNADARVESPVESLGRLAFLSCRRPPPLSNVWIEAQGRMYRADLLVPSLGVFLEADGAVKYNNRPDADSVVMAEKERERHLRSVGFAVVRYNFELALRRPSELVRRVDEAARLRGRMPVPDSWSLDRPPGPFDTAANRASGW